MNAALTWTVVSVLAARTKASLVAMVMFVCVQGFAVNPPNYYVGTFSFFLYPKHSGSPKTCLLLEVLFSYLFICAPEL